MRRWEERSPEIANLYNPAFCGDIIIRCINGFEQEGRNTFPFALCFLVLPIILDSQISDKINSRIRVNMHAWIQRDQEMLIDFDEKVKFFIPITRESIMFMLRYGKLTLDIEGNVVRIIREESTQKKTELNGEMEESAKKAQILGGWLNKAGNVSTIFSMWGIKP